MSDAAKVQLAQGIKAHVAIGLPAATVTHVALAADVLPGVEFGPARCIVVYATPAAPLSKVLTDLALQVQRGLVPLSTARNAAAIPRTDKIACTEWDPHQHLVPLQALLQEKLGRQMEHFAHHRGIRISVDKPDQFDFLFGANWWYYDNVKRATTSYVAHESVVDQTPFKITLFQRQHQGRQELAVAFRRRKSNTGVFHLPASAAAGAASDSDDDSSISSASTQVMGARRGGA
jgi:hypothetical protein